MFVDKLGLWSDVDLCWQKDKDLWKVKGKRSYCVFQSLIQSRILACNFLSGGMSFGSVTNDSIKSLSSSYEMFLKCRQMVNAFMQNCTKLSHIRHVLRCLLCLWLLPFPQLQGVVKMNSSRFEVLLSLNSSAEISNQGKHIICGLLRQNRIINIFSSSFIW